MEYDRIRIERWQPCQVLLIREMCQDDIAPVARLVKCVFDRTVAPDYGPEGQAEFAKFIDPEAFRRRLEAGGIAWVACLDVQVVAMLEVRDKSHICLFFTANQHQGQGIGRQLMAKAVVECQQRHGPLGELTVNSAPRSVAIYRRLGFVETSDEQEKNGIRFIPMSLTL